MRLKHYGSGRVERQVEKPGPGRVSRPLGYRHSGPGRGVEMERLRSLNRTSARKIITR